MQIMAPEACTSSEPVRLKSDEDTFVDMGAAAEILLDILKWPEAPSLAAASCM